MRGTNLRSDDFPANADRRILGMQKSCGGKFGGKDLEVHGQNATAISRIMASDLFCFHRNYFEIPAKVLLTCSR
jgi:hypothetical protein